jgi:predicted XRE-type DNA-binding protein
MSTTLLERFYSKVDKNGPVPEHRSELGACWIWTARLSPIGYGEFWFEGRMHGAHRVAWFLEHGSWPDPCALHACDNRACVRVTSHLFEGSQVENIADRDTKGRTVVPSQRGVAHSQAKLNEALVRQIRAAIASGESQPSIALRLGVSRSAINNVANGYCWGHVQ